MVSIQDVTAKRGNLLSIVNLGGTGPWLRILPSHARDADDWLVRTINQNQRHLKEKLDFRLDRLLRAIVEELGAVTTLK